MGPELKKTVKTLPYVSFMFDSIYNKVLENIQGHNID